MWRCRRMAVDGVGVPRRSCKWHLPPHENDFGTTLGKWGVEPGPYLMLPLLGPATLRDTPGFSWCRERLTDPVTSGLSPRLRDDSALRGRGGDGPTIPR